MNNQINNNAIAILAVALVGLQNVVAASREGRVIILPTFGGWADKNVQEFIWQLEIVFLANQIINNRKFNIEISCLIDMMANWYELNKANLVN